MYRIVTDGSCDLGTDLTKKLDVDVVPFYISLDGVNYQKEIAELGIREFYQFMVDNPKVFPKTSMPSIQDYLDAFKPLAAKKIDIICICITTKFSGSYNSANSAKDILLEKYPERKIVIMDSTLATVLQGLLVLEACKLQQDNYSLEEAVNRLNQLKSTGRIFFTVGNFEYLIHGGRIGKVAGVAAQTLGIRPIIVMQEGEIFSKGITRGRGKSKKKAIACAIDYLHSLNKTPDQYSICVGYGYDREEGESFLEELKLRLAKEFPGYHDDIMISPIGATIGVHTGLYPIGLGIIEKI